MENLLSIKSHMSNGIVTLFGRFSLGNQLRHLSLKKVSEISAVTLIISLCLFFDFLEYPLLKLIILNSIEHLNYLELQILQTNLLLYLNREKRLLHQGMNNNILRYIGQSNFLVLLLLLMILYIVSNFLSILHNHFHRIYLL